MSLQDLKERNKDRLPKLLGNKELSPQKARDKLDQNYGTAINNNYTNDLIKLMLPTDCINEKTIESVNDGDVKRILKTSADSEIHIKPFITKETPSNHRRREQTRRELNGIRWTSFCIPPEKNMMLNDILRISIKEKSQAKAKACELAIK